MLVCKACPNSSAPSSEMLLLSTLGQSQNHIQAPKKKEKRERINTNRSVDRVVLVCRACPKEWAPLSPKLLESRLTKTKKEKKEKKKKVISDKISTISNIGRNNL